MGTVMITNEALAQMQAESRKRHKAAMTDYVRGSIGLMGIAQIGTAPSELKNVSFFGVDKFMDVAPKKKKKPRKKRQYKKFSPDLMAAMLKTTPTVTNKPAAEPIIPAAAKESSPKEQPKIKDMSHTKQMPVHIPHPGPAKKWLRDVTRVPMLPDYSKRESFVRPAANYTNIPSPYGIWTEMAADQLKKSG